MAYIEIRASGLPKRVAAGKKPRRVREVFRNTSGGIAKKNSFVAGLTEVKISYDVRHVVGGRLTSEACPTKREADARVAEIEAASSTGYAIDPARGRMTVDELAERWLTSDPGKRGSTVGRDRSALRAHISPAIGSRQLSSIRQSDVQQLVNEWTKKMAPRTVDRTYGTLRAAFAYAVMSDLISRSPCHDVNLPKAVKPVRQVVSPDDVAKVASAIDARYVPMVWVGALLGLRWGEVAALRVKHLDLLARTLTVAETVTRDEHGRSQLGPPKSVAGNRTMSLPQALVDMLAEHLAFMALTGTDADAFLFPAPGGVASPHVVGFELSRGIHQ